MPFELRPYPNETLDPKGEYLQKGWAKSVYPMAEKFGVKIVLPDVSPQPYTHLAFEGYQYAKEKGKGNEYNHRILKAFFQEGMDIGKVDVLTKLASEIGLDEKEYKEALEQRRYKEAHQKALKFAYDEMQIDAVPTFIIGNNLLPGLYSEDSLQEIIDEELNK